MTSSILRRGHRNGRYGIRELGDICLVAQLELCRNARQTPDLAYVTSQARALGAVGEAEITERAIIVEGLDEPPRSFLQHTHGHQIRDRGKPHHYRRHGRADIGRPVT
ncbi:hypothetical protein [Streptosporangium sp. NPDC000396]|uniref:hypothetical protein n=1 Tax=Streptosporangium sp. NPDC000396 TaxID=3366185 RepID=UPI0036CEFF09